MSEIVALGAPINTPGGTEFGAWVDSQERHLLFARGIDDDPAGSGVFYSTFNGEV